ncbi:hypothetical protein FPRO06_07474 [Fusarium proliferatum]|nr:hypothetical protein FPRO06_07474 [Fusarium proliferatum]
MNQECIFSDIRPSPAPYAHRYPPEEGTYGPLGEPPAQIRNQYRDIGSSGYEFYPSFSHYHYPQDSHPPPPDHRGDHRSGLASPYEQRQDDHGSLKAYLTSRTPLQEPTSSLSDNQTSVFLDLNDVALDSTASDVPIKSMPTVGDHDVSEARGSDGFRSLERYFQKLQDRRLQGRVQRAPPSIPRFPVPQFLKRQHPRISPQILHDQDRETLNLREGSGNGPITKLATGIEASKESIELPDPAQLSIGSPPPSPSPTVSSDIEVDSISGDSEGQIDSNSLGYCFFDRIFCRLAILSQNEAAAKGESSNSSSKGKEVAKDGSTRSSRTRDIASTAGGRKNRRQGDDCGDESGDRQNEPPKKKGKTSQSHCDERSQFLACPYWKADSKKYWDCFLKKNDTIAHLKQHLTRRHTPKYYCQICYQTFRDFDLFDSHALERSCTRGPSAKLEGISQRQKNQLSLKSKGSVEQQWYTVWSILFPDMEPPATIYIYSTQSEDLSRIQEFAQREGVVIMLQELESSGLVVRPDASNQLLRTTVQRAMVSIFRSYSIRREPSSEAEDQILGQSLEPENEESLQQGSTTEGQIGHGHLPTTSTDINRRMDDGTDDSMIEMLNRPSMSAWSQLPTTTSWLPRGVVQDNTEDEPWGPAFPDEPAFGESSSGNDLPFNFESSDMLDLDALLRDVISTEA